MASATAVDLANTMVRARDRAATEGFPDQQAGSGATHVTEGRHYDRGSSRSISPGDEMDLAAHVKRLFYQARSARRPLVQQWIDNYQVIRNNTWGTPGARPRWQPSPEVPEIYPILAALIGWETDQRPTFDVAPAAQPFSPSVQFYDLLANDLQTVLQNTWRTEDYDAELEKMLWDAKVYGTGILKTCWDPTLAGGLGDAMLRRVDPFTFYPDPNARSMKDMGYCVEVYTISAQELERRFPGALDKMANGLWAEPADESPTVLTASVPRLPMANPGAISPSTNPTYGLPGQTERVDVTDETGITVFEAWLRTPCQVDTEYPDGQPLVRRYDTWRCVAVAGNTVVFDAMADEIYEHGQHPYDRYVPHDTGEFWGVSLVELLAPAQRSVNRLLAAIEQNIDLMGNPVFIEGRNSGLQRTTATNRPGQRLTLNPGTEARWLDPPQMHPQMSNELIRFYISEMERISGLSAIVRGATPTGRNAQGVIDSVQDAAFVRVRLGLRSLERTLKSAGEKAASLIVDFYDTPRLVAIIGPNGEKTSLALRPNHFYLPSGQGRVPMRFQLNISAGSQDATSRNARVAEADALYAMGAIDEEAVLEAHNFPNRSTVLARVRELKATAGILGQPPGARQRAHH